MRVFRSGIGPALCSYSCCWHAGEASRHSELRYPKVKCEGHSQAPIDSKSVRRGSAVNSVCCAYREPVYRCDVLLTMSTYRELSVPASRSPSIF